ncbi:flagellar basal body rod protein FlgC [Stappia sp.]|uniref:hypothetical protein n=1 Tax=Stappia sp. TaxID=1870903 RepID=UPI003A996AF0
MSALTTSLAGMLGAQKRFESSARQIVASGAEAGNAVSSAPSGAPQSPPAGGAAPLAGGPPGVQFSPDMASAMIDMLSAERSFEANATVARRSADMERAYLDMTAPRRDE